MTIDYSIKVTQCEPMPGYKLKVTCSDGATGIFDMSRYIDRGMFKPLKDPQTFDRVRLAFGVPATGISDYALLGLVLGVMAQLGDFFESALKRSRSVKDSGNVLPGHGGVLDRVDSLLFVIPTYECAKALMTFF